MKIRNYGIIAATAAVLLATALLVTTCLDPMSGFAGFGGGTATGKSVLTININDTNARTIMPDFPATPVYDLTITGTGGTLDPNPAINQKVITGGLTTSEELPEGNYLVSIRLLNGAGGAVIAANSNNISITNAAVSTTVILAPVADGAATGTIAWDFTLPSNLAGGSATMLIESLAGARTVIPGIAGSTNLVGNALNSAPISSGYYRVTISFTLTGHHSFTVQDTVHIYQGMTTTADINFADLVPLQCTITYTDVGSDSGTAPAAINANFGTTILLAPTTDLELTGNILAGWQTTNNVNWIFGASGTIVIGNVTLNPRWGADIRQTANISITNISVDDLFNDGNAITQAAISQLDIYNDDAVINLVVADPGDLEDFKWFWNGVEILNSMAHVTISGAENTTIAIDLGKIHAVGTGHPLFGMLAMADVTTRHYIYVSAFDGLIPWSGIIQYEVAP
ncbi:MAG: hypothetical protein FWD47_07960 [Treponema sp.]|nr:hypothetical protein [Treponema sp.]